MFTQTWNKYLPVIRILLKRSLHADQTLDMNESDFQRAAGWKKVKFTFSAVLINARLTGPGVSPLASDFATVLLQDDAVHEFLRKKTVMFTMNSSFQLQIKNITPPAEEVKTGETTVASKEENPE